MYMYLINGKRLNFLNLALEWHSGKSMDVASENTQIAQNRKLETC